MLLCLKSCKPQIITVRWALLFHHPDFTDKETKVRWSTLIYVTYPGVAKLVFEPREKVPPFRGLKWISGQRPFCLAGLTFRGPEFRIYSLEWPAQQVAAQGYLGAVPFTTQPPLALKHLLLPSPFHPHVLA